MKKVTLLAALAFAGALTQGAALAEAAKPNILVIFGDDIGYWNLSYNNDGMMGYRTPNIDRIANEGMRFTDYYAEQSCTAGRAAFITGQMPVRTGLTKVGIPGADLGIQKEDPTLAELLKPMGYATGQFGKNHLGDRDEFLPTNHGFDEFFGNLYHLNAEEAPEHPNYPKNPEFREKFGPRGVLHSWAMPDGTQKIEDTGPLTKTAHGDGGPGVPGRDAELHRPPAPGRQALLRLVQLDAHALRDPCAARVRRQVRVSISTPTACSSTTTRSASC